jgi:hypothetical protein
MRRGQLSLFIIIGLVIIIIGGAVYYMNSRSSQAATEPAPAKIATGEDIIQRVNGYVSDCLRAALSGQPDPHSDPLLWEFAAHGAKFPPYVGNIYDRAGTLLEVWCDDGSNKGCVNKAPSRELIAQDITAVLLDPSKSALGGCLAQLKDATKPIIPGGKVDFSDVKINVTVNPAEVIVRLSMNGTARLQDIEKGFGEFVTRVQVPLGRLVQIGTDIVNAEGRNGSFDDTGYMAKTGFDVLIQKERPYPNIIYNLSTKVPGYDKPLRLVFAIKGKRTQNKEVRRIEPLNGCCLMPSLDCRSNIQQNDCVTQGGTYDDKTSCSCGPVAKPAMVGCCQHNDNSCSLVKDSIECDGKFFKDDLACKQAECTNLACDSTAYYYSKYSGTMNNMDSWCTSDTVTGFGTDFVGNRHYVHSCVDGKEIVEPCRDYREEICVEGNDNAQQRRHAECKTNRWYDCSNQKTQSACEDLSRRDCFWIPRVGGGGGSGMNHPLVVYSKKPCVPFVPPGFAVWSPSAEYKAVCSQINQNPIFDPGPKAQGFNTLHICSRLGDCGNKRNWLGELTKKGYKNPVGKPKSKHYNAYTLLGYESPIGMTAGIEPNGPMHYQKLYNAQRQIYGWVTGITLDQALKTTVDATTALPTTTKKGAIKCKPWVQPATVSKQLCERCNADPLRPCTEYRCKSIGQCSWNEEKGVGNCTYGGLGGATGTSGPIITADPSSFKLNGDVLPTSGSISSNMPGITITQPLPGQALVSFVINTDKTAVCSASFVPPGFGDNDALEAAADIIDPRVAVTAFDMPIGPSEYAKIHPAAFRTPSMESMDLLLAILPKPELTAYITCEDEEGNPSQTAFALTLSVSGEDVQDTQGPVVSVAEIVNDPEEGMVMHVAMDEPVDNCRIGSDGGYDTRPVLEDCAPGPFDLALFPWESPPGAATNIGDYTCSVPVPDPKPTVVTCEDLSGNFGEPHQISQ